jgi:hypothetical protein
LRHPVAYKGEKLPIALCFERIDSDALPRSSMPLDDEVADAPLKWGH